VRRLVATAAAPRRRQADRAALVAAQRHVGLAGDHDRGAAVRRRPAQVGGIVRVGGLGLGIARQPAAVEAEGGDRRLADDVGAGVEQARYHRRVLAGHVALEDRRAVEHRDVGDADVVLDADGAPRKRALRRAGDGAPPAPAVRRVLRAGRPVAGVGARVLDGQRLVLELVEPGVARRRRLGERVEGLDLLLREVELEGAGDLGELLAGRWLDRHGRPPGDAASWPHAIGRRAPRRSGSGYRPGASARSAPPFARARRACPPGGEPASSRSSAVQIACTAAAGSARRRGAGRG
jgi:hypothetical protein